MLWIARVKKTVVDFAKITLHFFEAFTEDPDRSTLANAYSSMCRVLIPRTRLSQPGAVLPQEPDTRRRETDAASNPEEAQARKPLVCLNFYRKKKIGLQKDVDHRGGNGSDFNSAHAPCTYS